MSKNKDDSSWKAGAIRNKDARHTHEGQEVPKHKGKRKDTKRWCKGKVGREHTYDLIEAKSYPSLNLHWELHRCSQCGKKKYHHPKECK